MRIQPPRLPFEGAIDSALLAGSTAVLILLIGASRLLISSSIVGGDLGGHSFMTSFLRDTLLPAGEISGWTDSWFLGFPIYHFYFPMPALVQAALSAVFPDPAAFSMGVVVGTFLLPAAAYGLGRLLQLPFPIPVLMGLGAAAFASMTSFDHFGANLLSSLRGEYAFSLGTSLALLTLGLWFQTLISDRPRMLLTGLTVGLGIMTHFVPVALTFLTIFTSGALAVAAGHTDIRRLVERLTVPIVVGFGLSATFWIPFLIDHTYTSNAGLQGGVRWSQVLPDELGPLAAAVPLLLLVGIRRRSLPEIFVAGIPLNGLFAYLVVPGGQLGNVRFLPFWYLGVWLCLAYLIGLTVRLRAGRRDWWVAVSAGVGVAAALAATFLWTNQARIERSAEATFRGLEAMPASSSFEQLVTAMNGLPPGRVIAERSTEWLAHIGTDVPFAALPFDLIHSSARGVNRQASSSTPYIADLEQQLSPGYDATTDSQPHTPLNSADAARYAGVLDVNYFVAVTEAAKEEIRRTGAADELGRYGPFTVYQFSEPSPVVVPAFTPAVLVNGDWDVEVRKWWRLQEHAVALVDRGPSTWPRVSSAADLPRQRRGIVRSIAARVEDGRVEFWTDHVGEPHWIKVSYFPKWRAVGASGPFRASPSVMIVVPTQEHVLLTYTDRLVDKAATAVSGATVVALAASVVRSKLRRRHKVN